MSQDNQTTKRKKRPSPQIDKLEAIGIDAICERIEAGESQREIAASVGCDVTQVNRWLNSDEHAQRSMRARIASAEAWLDRGLEAIASALRKDGGIDASAARAYAQECARRAAVRNPQYSDRQRHEVTGANGSPLATESKIDFGSLSPDVLSALAGVKLVSDQ